MKILQFAFGAGHDQAYLPHHHDKNSVVYTGTHDNNTTMGWWHSESAGTREHVTRYIDKGPRSDHDVVWDFIRLAMLSVADTAIVPFQDILALDAGARMNLPGETDGNWSWRVRREAFHENLSHRLRPLLELGDRLVRPKTPAHQP